MGKRFTDEEFDAWVPEEALEALKFERITEPELTDEERARRTLMQGAPMAARSLVHLSVHGKDERVRLQASQYVINGVVGGNFSKNGTGGNDLLLALVEELGKNDDIPLRERL